MRGANSVTRSNNAKARSRAVDSVSALRSHAELLTVEQLAVIEQGPGRARQGEVQITYSAWTGGSMLDWTERHGWT